MATILGENVNLAKRTGLLHDFVKAIDDEVEGNHVEIENIIAKKYKENEVVINAIESHVAQPCDCKIIRLRKHC